MHYAHYALCTFCTLCIMHIMHVWCLGFFSVSHLLGKVFGWLASWFLDPPLGSESLRHLPLWLSRFWCCVVPSFIWLVFHEILHSLVFVSLLCSWAHSFSLIGFRAWSTFLPIPRFFDVTFLCLSWDRYFSLPRLSLVFVSPFGSSSWSILSLRFHISSLLRLFLIPKPPDFKRPLVPGCMGDSVSSLFLILLFLKIFFPGSPCPEFHLFIVSRSCLFVL